MVGGFLDPEGKVMPRQSIQIIHEGKYAAQVPVEVVDDDGPWSPTLSLDEMRKLDRVRLALRRGDVAAAAKEAKIFELLPLAG
jgi:hypothetical protein